MATSIGDGGITRPLLIDGVELSVMPDLFDLTPEPISDYHDMLDGGAREQQRRPYFDGIANYSDRVTISVPFAQLVAADIVKMEEIIARGGLHRVTVWRMRPVIYTCLAGLVTYYLPRFRKCAGHLYSGLVLDGGGASTATVSTTEFPMVATLGGDPLDVAYADGPSLSSPGAGALVVARQPDTTGETMDYTKMRLGDVPAGGEELKLWACWTYECSLRAPRISVRGAYEDHAYTFVEV